jgi:hypothetical protein
MSTLTRDSRSQIQRIAAALGRKFYSVSEVAASSLPSSFEALAQSYVSAGNAAGSMTDLHSYTLAPGRLANDGDCVEFEYAGRYADVSGSQCRLLVTFGGTTIATLGAPTDLGGASDWRIIGRIVRTGATTQKAQVALYGGPSIVFPYSSYSTATETLSGALDLKLKGIATSANDVVKEMAVIDFRAAA